jgi:hypothetical protein
VIMWLLLSFSHPSTKGQTDPLALNIKTNNI